MNLFERASRKNLMLTTSKGTIGVNDLWDLPLTSANNRQANLDDIARTYNERVSKASVSFVETSPSQATEDDRLTFELVKHVIAVKIAENKAAAEARNKAAQKQRILEIMAEKQDESLKGKSIEELQQLLAQM